MVQYRHQASILSILIEAYSLGEAFHVLLFDSSQAQLTKSRNF